MSRIGYCALAMGMMLLACGGESAGPDAGERKGLLVGKDWVAKRRTISPGFPGGPGGVSTDYYVAGAGCYRDDIYRFTVDGKFEEDAGPEKCQWQQVALRNGTWSLNDAGTEIVLDMEDNSDSTVWKIASMDEGNLTVTYPSGAVWGDGVKRQETLVLGKR